MLAPEGAREHADDAHSRGSEARWVVESPNDSWKNSPR
jgi:hypothetical protein